ncbi:MAG TPA: hypothetical protein VLT33_00675, partial [Labilithrix sp.]|nr:hypothetical protein [Labilithrix sp.]
MRLGLTSYVALCAVVSAGALTVACSDDGGAAAPVDAGSLSDGALPDASTPDASTPDSSTPDSPDPNDGFAPAEIAAMSTLSPLPSLPADPTNAFANNALAAVLGQRLFFDKALSGALVVGDDGTNGGLGAVGETG